MSETQRSKRPAPSRDERPAKRRDPYTPRACDACKRRKGKCCGRHPCEYCVNRNQVCHYSVFAGDWRPTASSVDGSSNRDKISTKVPALKIPAILTPDSSLGSLGELLATLQGQIDSFAAQMRQDNEQSKSPSAPSTRSSQTLVDPGTDVDREPVHNNFEPTKLSYQMTEGSATGRDDNVAGVTPPSKFYGPTSPDYSLNIAQLRLRQGSLLQGLAEQPNLASIDDDHQSEEDEEDSGSSSANKGGRLPSTCMRDHAPRQRLLFFRDLFTLDEALLLLQVYQKVVGEYHPLVDVHQVTTQIEWWYGWANTRLPSPADEDNLLVANLALSIALCAESTSPPSEAADRGALLYSQYRDLAHAKLLSLTPNIKTPLITLLVGVLHFYQDKPRFAWRMCGLAGRTLMELGLHNRDVSRHVLATDQQWKEYAVLTISIAILDRQWSSATGLPTHFTNSNFDLELRSLVKNPYLNAMVPFILISDKFSEPSLRVANGGGTYEDDGEFDIMNFQVEQWRSKAVGTYGVERIRAGHPPSRYPPAWAILVHLRANSVLGMLRRPFFFGSADTAVSLRNIQPCLDLITDTIDILCMLDLNTDIYSKQHPYFQHFLASACAVLFLIIAYVEQNRATLEAELPHGFSESVAKNFRNAFSLATTYCKSSHASRRLWKRLVVMKKRLLDIGVLSGDDECVTVTKRAGAISGGQQSVALDGISTLARPPAEKILSSDGRSGISGTSSPFMYSGQFLAISPSDSIGGIGLHDFSVDWGSMSEEWQVNNANDLFFGPLYLH